MKRFKTPLRKMLMRRIWIERAWRRYPNSWRFTRGIRESVGRYGERIKNIACDYAHKVGDEVAEIASEYSAVIALENLNHLRGSVKRSTWITGNKLVYEMKGCRTRVRGSSSASIFWVKS